MPQEIQRSDGARVSQDHVPCNSSTSQQQQRQQQGQACKQTFSETLTLILKLSYWSRNFYRSTVNEANSISVLLFQCCWTLTWCLISYMIVVAGRVFKKKILFKLLSGTSGTRTRPIVKTKSFCIPLPVVVVVADEAGAASSSPRSMWRTRKTAPPPTQGPPSSVLLPSHPWASSPPPRPWQRPSGKATAAAAPDPLQKRWLQEIIFSP